MGAETVAVQILLQSGDTEAPSFGVTRWLALDSDCASLDHAVRRLGAVASSGSALSSEGHPDGHSSCIEMAAQLDM
eukprot:6226520-Prymnesium_polylepis.2